MNKEMIISSSGHETQLAILEDDLVTEIFIERERERGVVGNVYKGCVSRVLPGMQSAFVDLGLERDAFLYVSDVLESSEHFEVVESAGEDEDIPANVELSTSVDGDTLDKSGSGSDKQPRGQTKIEDLLHQGQDVLVQVVKAPLGTKGARITSHISIAGRFLVFMPTVGSKVGVSRKIASREERSRLRRIVREFRERKGFAGGVIIRTAAASCSEEDILKDLEYFQRLWSEIQSKSSSVKAPSVVYQEQNLIAKVLRDLLNESYSAIRINDAREYQRVRDLVERFMPNLLERVTHYTKDFPIFEEYGVQDEIDEALQSKVWLKSGGYIVINQTEALVAIDVNTGRYVGKRTGRLEDTIVKTNLEAVKEIVRQLRLRDLGGIIVLDFIDMEERKNRQKVYQALDQELRRDRAPSKTLQVTDFGLIIVTRKRVKQSLEHQLTDPCPYCSGSGLIRSSATICYEILTEIRKFRDDLNGSSILLRVNPEIAAALQEEEPGILREIQEIGRQIMIKPDANLHHEQFDVMTI